jgi:hypothetical protein
MAKKYTVDLEVNTGKSDANIGDVVKAIKELNEAVVNGSKKSEESLEGVEAAAKKSASGVSKLGKILNNLAKAGGVIFLLNKAFEFFKEVASENQKVVDFFSITMEALSIAFNDLFKFIGNNVGTIVGYFKAIFDDPVQSIKDFGSAIYDGVVVRIQQAIEAFGILGKAAMQFLSGDLAGAAVTAKEGFVELFDVVTGADNGLETIKNTIKGVANSVIDYSKSTIDAAKSTVELNKQAEIAGVLQQGLVEKYDRQAEKLRQVRDEERNTIADRIAANEQLKAVLDEQEAAMLQQVDTIIAAAQAQYNKNANQANYIALLEATQEREAVLAQIEGFRSEQLSNDLALNRESLELTQSQADASAERAISEQQFLAEQIQGEYLRLEALKSAAEQEAIIEEERLTNKRNQYKAGTQAFVDANNELLAFQQENAQQQIKIDRDLNLAKQQLVTDALGNLASIVGENSKFGKGIALVQAIRDTYAGANLALASAPPPFNFISAAAVIAGGLVNVKKITATKAPQAPSFARGAGGGGGSVSVPTPQAPSFNVVGASSNNQLAETIAGQNKQPLKAYVVASDVSTAQSLERNIVSSASI